MSISRSSSKQSEEAVMARQQPLSGDTRKAMVSQFLGFGLDAYDMAMVVVMAPILTKLFIAPGGSAAWRYTEVCCCIQ